MPYKNAPVEVGQMKQLTVGQRQDCRARSRAAPVQLQVDGRQGPHADGSQRCDRHRRRRHHLHRRSEDRACPSDEGWTAKGVLAHEFYLWHDPKNSNRLLVLSQTYGSQDEDLIITAITDEKTGEVLKDPVFLASFTLENVGGPIRNERPDSTGLYASGRFADYREMTDQWGRPGASQPGMVNSLHSGTMSDDGERFYVAGTTAGFYILDTEKIGQSTNAQIAAGSVVQPASSNAWVDGKVGGVVDVKKVPEVAKDCIHPMLNSDPGVLAMLKSDRSDADKLARYTRLETRSRFAFTPPLVAMVGVHSAVPVPGRPSHTRGQHEEPPGVGRAHGRMAVRAVPGARHAHHQRRIGNHADADRCDRAVGQRRRELRGAAEAAGLDDPPMMHAHNPTVLPNIVFVGWLGTWRARHRHLRTRSIRAKSAMRARCRGGDMMTYPDIHRTGSSTSATTTRACTF